MTSLSRREKIYVGVFVVTLLWGLWNFRDHFGAVAGSPPRKPAATSTGQPATGSPGASPGTVGAPHRNGPHPADTTRFKPPPWGTDPFHRTWRG